MSSTDELFLDGQLVDDGEPLGERRFGSPGRGRRVVELEQQVLALHRSARPRSCRPLGQRDEGVPAQLAVSVEGDGHADVVEDQHRAAAAALAQVGVALRSVALAAFHEHGEQRLVGGAARAVLARRGRELHGSEEKGGRSGAGSRLPERGVVDLPRCGVFTCVESDQVGD